MAKKLSLTAKQQQQVSDLFQKIESERTAHQPQMARERDQLHKEVTAIIGEKKANELQQMDKKHHKRHKGKQQKKNKTATERAERIAKKLNLTKTQQTQLTTLFQKRESQMAEKRELRKTKRGQYEKELEAIIGTDKFTTWKVNRDKRRLRDPKERVKRGAKRNF